MPSFGGHARGKSALCTARHTGRTAQASAFSRAITLHKCSKSNVQVTALYILRVQPYYSVTDLTHLDLSRESRGANAERTPLLHFARTRPDRTGRPVCRPITLVCAILARRCRGLQPIVLRCFPFAALDPLDSTTVPFLEAGVPRCTLLLPQASEHAPLDQHEMRRPRSVLRVQPAASGFHGASRPSSLLSICSKAPQAVSFVRASSSVK